MKTLMKIILGIFAFMLIANFTSAQNTPGTPYAGSTHLYTVDADAITGHTLTWEVCSGSTWLLANKLSTNIGIVIDNSDNDNSKATITWGTGLTAGDYTIRFIEDDGVCQSIRTSVVDLKANTFDLAVSDVVDNCATSSVNGVVTTQGAPGSTIRTFTITNADASMTDWTYVLTYSVTGTTNAVYTIDVDGSASASGSTISVSGSQTSTVEFTVENANVLLAEQNITLSVVNNNTGLVELNGGNNSDTSLIFKLPNTGDITF
jgi:hypothetical protein